MPLIGRRHRWLRQHGEHCVEQVTGTTAVGRGHRVRLPQAETPQSGRVRLTALIIDLVRGEHDRLAGTAQDPRHAFVRVGRSHGRVQHEEHHIGEFDRDLGLVRHRTLQPPQVGLPPAGVHQDEVSPGPIRPVADPVAGHPRHVLHDRLATAEHPVDQRGLTDVGSPDHGHHRQDRLPRRKIRVRIRGEQGEILVVQVVLGQSNSKRLGGVRRHRSRLRAGQLGTSVPTPQRLVTHGPRPLGRLGARSRLRCTIPA